jgi:hypothetical protein
MAIGKQQINHLAQSAVKSYFDGNGSLQDQIIKIAEENKLSSHEIARVVEEANKAAHISIFAKSGPKDAFEFPLAKTAEVLKALNQDIEVYETPSPKDQAKTASKAIWTDTEDDNWDPKLRTRQQLIQDVLGQIGLAEAEMREKIASVESDISLQAARLIETMRQEFIEGESSPDGYLKAASEDRPQLLVLMESLIDEACQKSHMTKTASMPSTYMTQAPKLIPRRESRKAMIMTLDTIRDRSAEAAALHDGLVIIQDQAKRVAKSMTTDLSREYAL